MDDTQNRKIHAVRKLNAPIDLVWKVWSDAEHIVNWWGPVGFTNTIHKFEFKDGGEWRLLMCGPDGHNYPNRSIFKTVVPNEKMVMEHFNPHFIATVLFQSQGKQTQIDWSLLFDSVKDYEVVIKTFNADEGHKQNIEKLQDYLNQINTA